MSCLNFGSKALVVFIVVLGPFFDQFLVASPVFTLKVYSVLGFSPFISSTVFVCWETCLLS